MAAMHDQFEKKLFAIEYISTDFQAADIFTEAFPDPDKWRHALDLIGICDPKRLSELMHAPSVTNMEDYEVNVKEDAMATPVQNSTNANALPPNSSTSTSTMKVAPAPQSLARGVGWWLGPEPHEPCPGHAGHALPGKLPS